LLGRRVPDLDVERLREVVFKNYRIIYEPARKASSSLP
jgi:hypothetical protein